MTLNNENIFDLENNDSCNLTTMIPQIEKNLENYKCKKYTKKEIVEMLKNFVLIPQHEWATLNRDSFIRYERMDGNFRRGGYIINNYFDTKIQEHKFKLISDSSLPPNPQYNPIWQVKFKDLRRVWKKLVSPSNVEMGLIDNKFQECDSKIQNIQDEIRQIKSDIQHIIHWVKNNVKK